MPEQTPKIMKTNMHKPIQLKNMTTLSVNNSISRSPLRLTFLLIPLALCCFPLSPAARAVLPPPDGGYAGENTAEGDDALFSLTTGTSNTAMGFQALYGNTSSNSNTALGTRALYTITDSGLAGAGGNTAIGDSALYNNNSYQNTAIGATALYSDTTGGNNIAIGPAALYSNATGDNNVAIGSDALYYNLASNNTAMGTLALYANSTGNDNTATGLQALHTNTTGNGNTANGSQALFSNTTGNDNTANGFQALYANTIGFDNTASGAGALQSNTTGIENVANGHQALFTNTTGSNNTANGAGALYYNTTADNNTAYGYQTLLSNTTGSSNVALGFNAGMNLTTGSNNIDIGNVGVASDANTIRIGTQGTQTATFIAGIRGVPISGGMPIGVNSSGQLGVKPSSARYKEAIQPMDKASEAILALRAVTFRYKKEIDPDRTPEFGLVAEEVEKVDPDLVARDDQGKPFTVRYDAVNAMLLNEFLKEHRTVQALKSAAAKQEATIALQQNQIEALGAAIQKVSAQVEASKFAPQMAVNNQ
jgi:trimeric autotransporter adhesin